MKASYMQLDLRIVNRLFTKINKKVAAIGFEPIYDDILFCYYR